MFIFAGKFIGPMKQGVKRIVSIFLLLVFILPASGIILYVHHCSMSNSTSISSSSPESCCGGSSCSLPLESSHGNETVISKQACCSDSQVFVKLGYHLFAQAIKVLAGEYFIINNGVQYSRLLAIKSISSLINFNDFTDPPLEWGYVLFSSFRL